MKDHDKNQKGHNGIMGPTKGHPQQMSAFLSHEYSPTVRNWAVRLERRLQEQGRSPSYRLKLEPDKSCHVSRASALGHGLSAGSAMGSNFCRSSYVSTAASSHTHRVVFAHGLKFLNHRLIFYLNPCSVTIKFTLGQLNVWPCTLWFNWNNNSLF